MQPYQIEAGVDNPDTEREPNQEQSADDQDIIPMIIGVAVGAVVIAGIVAVVMVVIRKRATTKKPKTALYEAVSVSAQNVVPVVEETANTEETNEVVVETVAE